MRIRTILFFACLGIGAVAPSAQAAAPFNVGPYRLGMTNAEALKVGYSHCEFKSSETLCKPKLDGVSDVQKAVLTFDAKTKRLISIWVYISVYGPWGVIPEPAGGWKEDSDWGTLTSELEVRAAKELKIPECKSNLQDGSYRPATRESRCFILPNQMLKVTSGYNNIRSGGHRNRNVPHAAVTIEAMMGTEAQNRARRLKEQQAEAEKLQREEGRRQRFLSGK